LKFYGSLSSSLLQRCFKSAASSHCSESIVADIEQFFKNTLDESSLKTLDRPIKQVVESIRLKASILNRSSASIDEYLTKAGF